MATVTAYSTALRRFTPGWGGGTTEDAEVAEGLRMMSDAPRLARSDQELFVGGGRAPILPMPGKQDREPVEDTVNPLCPPCSLWFNPGEGGFATEDGRVGPRSGRSFPGRGKVVHILQGDPLAGPQRGASGHHSGEKIRMVLQAIVQPVLLGGEPDQDAGRPAMPSDDDLLLGGHPKVA